MREEKGEEVDENEREGVTSWKRKPLTYASPMTPPVRLSGTLFIATSAVGVMVHALCCVSESAAMDPARTVAPHALVAHEVVASLPLTHDPPFQYDHTPVF